METRALRVSAFVGYKYRRRLVMVGACLGSDLLKWDRFAVVKREIVGCAEWSLDCAGSECAWESGTRAFRVR